MPNLKRLLAFSALTAAFLVPAPKSQGQVSIGVNIGPEPMCPYGYFSYAPYNCAPYGYYGPDWFPGGVFVGAGPWFRGPEHFWGHVDNRWDPHYGYRGPFPDRGERPFWGFRGNEARDGRGHIGRADHGPGREHAPGYQHGGWHGRGGRGGRH
ncbi:MAG: hypothetical protein ACLGSD_08510 [Acidobacteriota bacterium]